MTSTELINNAITEFQISYQKIYEIYNSNSTASEKWTSIATSMNNNNDFYKKIYKSLKNVDERKQINLDYQLDIAQLDKQISEESNAIVKASAIILAIHHIIYNLMSTEGNYYFTLNGPEEMQVLKKEIVYYINIYKKAEMNIYFHAYILLYALESLFNRHFYLGIDFEYTNKKIQLAQLNFEHNVALQSIIMIVSPNELDAAQMNNFVDLIMCNKYIKKILHGSDSQDIPYVYNHMLQDNPNKIIRFTRTLIDTRFLCEYYKLTRDQPSDSRCSIYDQEKGRSAIYYFKVISEEQQDKLAELLESLPPSHDIDWHIRGLTKSQTLYAQYDVIYLKYFYYRIIYVAMEDEPTPSGKKAVIDIYKHVLNEITRFVYLERNNITYLMAKCKEEVDVVNNYFIRTKDGILKMIDIFNKVSQDLETANPAVSINKLTKVNHFKVPVMTLIKRITYGYISQKCRVQKDKTTVWTDKLYNQFIMEFLDKMNFYYLLRMFKELDKILETRVAQICKSRNL